MNAANRLKRIFGALCFFLLFASVLSAQAADPPKPADFQVILFENPNFEGGNMGYTYDNEISNLTRWNLPDGEKWNDRISSLAVGKNTRVILYQHSDYNGPSISFEGDGQHDLLVSDLHVLGWGDTVSSVRVRTRLVPGADEVLIFEHANYNGAVLSPNADGDYPDLRQNAASGSKTWNDRISSLKIGKGAAVLLCTDINYGGPCIFFSGGGDRDTDIISLHGTGWEDRISSMKVRSRGWTPWSESGGSSGESGGSGSSGGSGGSGGSGEPGSSGPGSGQGQGEEENEPMENEIMFFLDAGCQGEHRIYSLGENLPDLRQLRFWDSDGNWNDEISSLKIGANAQAYVCTHINYGVPCVQHRGNGTGVTRIDNLHGSGWGDRISSIKIRDKDWNPADDTPEPGPREVVVFEHVDYGGRYLVITANQHKPDLTREFFENTNTSWNDEISSFKVGSEVQVEFYEHINPGSNTRPIHTYPRGSKVPSLHPYGWGDKISAIRVLDDLGD